MMTYEQAYAFMIEKTHRHQEKYKDSYKNIKATLDYKPITIEYPGYKANGDYKVWYQTDSMHTAKAYTHADIVRAIYKRTNLENFEECINFLECLFAKGLNCTTTNRLKELIFWLTLQEDLNYPMPRYQGRKLPFQRYYEAILAKMGYYEIEDIVRRTNNHGMDKPDLLTLPKGWRSPIFYNLEAIF